MYIYIYRCIHIIMIFYGRMLGSNNCIGRFHKNFVTFRDPKLPDFHELKSCASKNATHCHTLRHTATHCNTLRHTATHRNTLQHTATQLKRCASKKAVLRYNKKAGKFGPVAPKCKMVENLHRIDRHRLKIGLNPNFLRYSNSPWTGTNMHTWFYGPKHSGKNFLPSSNPTWAHMGKKKTRE